MKLICILLIPLILFIFMINTDSYDDFIKREKQIIKYRYLFLYYRWLNKNLFNTIYYYANKRDIPIELICAVIQNESGGKNIRSRKNRNGTRDYGLMQVNEVHKKRNVRLLYKYKENIKIGTWYLSLCFKKSRKNIRETCRMYNSGLNNKKWKYKNWKYVDRIEKDYMNIKNYFEGVDNKILAFL